MGCCQNLNPSKTPNDAEKLIQESLQAYKLTKASFSTLLDEVSQYLVPKETDDGRPYSHMSFSSYDRFVCQTAVSNNPTENPFLEIQHAVKPRHSDRWDFTFELLAWVFGLVEDQEKVELLPKAFGLCGRELTYWSFADFLEKAINVFLFDVTLAANELLQRSRLTYIEHYLVDAAFKDQSQVLLDCVFTQEVRLRVYETVVQRLKVCMIADGVEAKEVQRSRLSEKALRAFYKECRFMLSGLELRRYTISQVIDKVEFSGQ